MPVVVSNTKKPEIDRFPDGGDSLHAEKKCGIHVVQLSGPGTQVPASPSPAVSSNRRPESHSSSSTLHQPACSHVSSADPTRHSAFCVHGNSPSYLHAASAIARIAARIRIAPR
jgi:hypothetical protein